MIVAIHQPNYFPWLGYFAKLAACDCFVIQDNVQFPGHSYVNRVQVRAPNGPTWLTVPVRRTRSGYQLIRSVEISAERKRHWFDRHLAMVREYYRSAPHWAATMSWMADVVRKDWSRLSEMNTHIIRDLASRLGISRDFRLASSLTATGCKTDLITSIVKEVGGDCYLRGQGAAQYQDDELLMRNGIQPVALSYSHPAYAQGTGDFVPGLSILDALFNCGFAGTSRLLQSSPAATAEVSRLAARAEPEALKQGV